MCAKHRESRQQKTSARKIQTLKTPKESRKVTETLMKLGQNCTMRPFTGSSFLTNWIRFQRTKRALAENRSLQRQGNSCAYAEDTRRMGAGCNRTTQEYTALACCRGNSTKTLSGGTENSMAVAAEFITDSQAWLTGLNFSRRQG